MTTMPTGFDRLPLIKNSIKLIYRRFGPRPFFLEDPHLFLPECVFNSGWSRDAIGYALVQLISRHLRIEGMTLIEAEFSSEIDSAARIELRGGHVSRILIHTDNDHPLIVAAALAHELSHAFLYQNDLGLPGILEDEILAETTAMFSGLGVLMMNGTKIHLVKQSQTTALEQSYGYISPVEEGYILARRAAVTGENPLEFLEGMARDAYAEGLARAMAESRTPPLAIGGSYAKQFQQQWNQWQEARQPPAAGELAPVETVIFECPRCSQKLRIPAHMTANVKCGNCQAELECVS